MITNNYGNLLDNFFPYPHPHREVGLGRPAPEALIELIYCANGNQLFARTAIEHGFIYGAQLPHTVYYRPEFVDQDWKNPDRAKYVASVRVHRPRMATVLDWEHGPQLPEVLSWAEDVAPWVETIIIIPKVPGGIFHIPPVVGGKPIRLGYSVPTLFSSTTVPLQEFGNWPTHLLGGSPHKQIELSRHLNVVSADGNMAQKMATRYCAFYDPWKRTARYYWPSILDFDGQRWGDGSDTAGAPYEAFRRSCQAIRWAFSNPHNFPFTR